MDIAFHAPRDDFVAAKVAIRMFDDAGNQQRFFHHLPHHGAFLVAGHRIPFGEEEMFH
jgi:hypothetical protein